MGLPASRHVRRGKKEGQPVLSNNIMTLASHSLTTAPEIVLALLELFMGRSLRHAVHKVYCVTTTAVCGSSIFVRMVRGEVVTGCHSAGLRFPELL